jgi:hypothetical protein
MNYQVKERKKILAEEKLSRGNLTQHVTIISHENFCRDLPSNGSPEKFAARSFPTPARRG